MTRTGNKLMKPIILSILVLISGVFLIPIIITISNSFMSPFEVITRYTPAVTAENVFFQGREQ